jgi:kynurenine formamidase
VVGPETAAGAGIFDFAKVPRESTSRANKLGIENMSERCVQGRAVMIDLHAHVGRGRALVDHDMLQDILKKDGVTVEPGDLVCLHTGFAQMLLEMNREPDRDALENSCAVLEGRDRRLLQWITDSGLAALIADNYAIEAHPASSHAGTCAALPLHEHCLFKLGVHLGEIWHLTPLADWLRAHRRNRFLLTAPPLRLPGAVGSPATPIATV